MDYCGNIAEAWSTKDITCWRFVEKNTEPKNKRQEHNTIILQMKHSKRTCDNKARSQQNNFQRVSLYMTSL